MKDYKIEHQNEKKYEEKEWLFQTWDK